MLPLNVPYAILKQRLLEMLNTYGVKESNIELHMDRRQPYPFKGV